MIENKIYFKLKNYSFYSFLYVKIQQRSMSKHRIDNITTRTNIVSEKIKQNKE